VNREIYATITNRFIEKLKEGTVPWQKPWLAAQNIISRKPYQGINALLLGSSDFKSPFWLSFKQALDLGGHVKKGERSTPVIYYKFLEKRDDMDNSVAREDGRVFSNLSFPQKECPSPGRARMELIRGVRALPIGTTTRTVSPTSWSGSMGRSQTIGFPCHANKECLYEFSDFSR
jgi:N-terminal domain of anti-restriction factor ArdC